MMQSPNLMNTILATARNVRCRLSGIFAPSYKYPDLIYLLKLSKKTDVISRGSSDTAEADKLRLCATRRMGYIIVLGCSG